MLDYCLPALPGPLLQLGQFVDEKNFNSFHSTNEKYIESDTKSSKKQDEAKLNMNFIKKIKNLHFIVKRKIHSCSFRCFEVSIEFSLEKSVNLNCLF